MKLSQSCKAVACSAMLGLASVNAQLDVDFTSDSSMSQAMSSLVTDMMKSYIGNDPGQTPGIFAAPNPLNGAQYYWWECGAMMGTLIDYWYYSGDTTYNAIVTQALQWQAGPDANYEPANQSLDLGNDDQAFWAFSAMEAAEYNFPNPPSDEPQWLELAQAVFNRQAGRWDTTVCGGGLEWQLYRYNPGWGYKNVISNGCLFQLGARLAKYTGNSTYSDWANKAYNWITAIGLVTDTYTVNDGTSTDNNCSNWQQVQWTYNYATLIYGAAVMWNISQEQLDSGSATAATDTSLWSERTTGLINKTVEVFFKNNILCEVSCEDVAGRCDNDQQSFKAYYARFLSATTRVAPWTMSIVQPLLYSSAEAAAKSCVSSTGGGTQCGLRWDTGSYDGVYGVGEQMNAIEIIGAQIMFGKAGPLTASTGGNSSGDPSAGTGETELPPEFLTSTITVADRAGAGFMTVIACALTVALALFTVISGRE